MLSLPNILSLFRIPLAFLFLQANPFIRSLAIILALITDGLDGFLARRNSCISRLGTLLDPLTDKFFVLFALIMLLNEQNLELWKILALFSRDFAITIYGFYLFFKGKLAEYRFRAIWWGKVSTVMQLILLMAMIWQIPLPASAFIMFIILGLLSLGELFLRKETGDRRQGET